jgi:hypothetical protein
MGGSGGEMDLCQKIHRRQSIGSGEERILGGEMHHGQTISGLVLVRGAVSPAAQAWVMDAIRSDDIIDFPSGGDDDVSGGTIDANEKGGRTVENEAGEKTETTEKTDAKKLGRRNQMMRFGDLPPWARVLAAEVTGLARGDEGNVGGGGGGVQYGQIVREDTGEVPGDGAGDGDGEKESDGVHYGQTVREGGEKREGGADASQGRFVRPPLFPPEVLSRGIGASTPMFNQVILNSHFVYLEP